MQLILPLSCYWLVSFNDSGKKDKKKEKKNWGDYAYDTLHDRHTLLITSIPVCSRFAYYTSLAFLSKDIVWIEDFPPQLFDIVQDGHVLPLGSSAD